MPVTAVNCLKTPEEAEGMLADGVTESALTVTDAVLAAADETESLASAAATLTVAGGTVRRG